MFSSSHSQPFDINKVRACKFFLSGKCTAGINCPFPHIHNNNDNNNTTANTTTTPNFDSLSSLSLKDVQLSLGDAILPSSLFEELGFISYINSNNNTSKIIPPQKNDDYKDIKLCPFHIIGKCKFGQDGCRMVHGTKCIYCHKNSIDIRHPNDHLSKCKLAPNYQAIEGDDVDGESRIDCRHWNGRDGSCPFGQSCYYNHGIDSSNVGGGSCGDEPRLLRLCDFLFK